MTDGIIQQVIRRWQYLNSKTDIGQYEIYRLQQELIEKIKQKGKQYHFEFEGSTMESIPVQELIGDSK